MQQIATLLNTLARGIGKLWGKGCIGKVIVGFLALVIIGICAAPFRGASQTTPIVATGIPVAQVAATAASTEPPAPTSAPPTVSPIRVVAVSPTATEPLPTVTLTPTAILAPTVAPTSTPAPTARPKPAVAPKPTPAPVTGVRVGAICRDGTRSSATGRGACSHHGGVDHWLYK